MRLSTRNRFPIYRLVLTVVVCAVIIGGILFVFEYAKNKGFKWESLLLILIPLIVLCFFYIIGKPVFEYDSDGEAIICRNKGVLPFQKYLNDEFPKYKLISYDIVSLWFMKRLYLKLSSKRKKELVLQYEVSLLSAREIRDLKISLNKVIKQQKN